MTRSVTIRVPARLHLGFLDPSGGAGRRFGSLGLPLSEPETVLTLSRGSETVVEGPEADRAFAHLALMTRHLGIRSQHRLIVDEAIPRHAGLGSGTQIALAVAAALRTLRGLPLDPDGDAMLLSRGARSGVGIASFTDGGIIVDAGSTTLEIVRHLHKVRPVYETLPGWQCDIDTCAQVGDFPAEARDYLRFVEEVVGVPISFVGVGPDRAQTVVLPRAA